MTAFGEVETAVRRDARGRARLPRRSRSTSASSRSCSRASSSSAGSAQEAGLLRARLAEKYSFDNIIGTPAPMQAVFKTVAQIAASRASVLITGESGTGKELIAAAIHERSPRAKGPFVKLHCAALAESLLESELFGHERGSFTGAQSRGATGASSRPTAARCSSTRSARSRPAVQVKLLRFLQEREFERVGGNETISVDVRVIAATNRDLKKMVADGKFREDLFYRLNVINLEMPALRARPSDVPLLAAHFLRKYAAENGKELGGFSTEALEHLSAYGWPGNVRELENVVERAVVLAQAPRDHARRPAAAPRAGEGARGPADPGRDDGRDRALRDHEDARGDGRLDEPRRRDPEDERAQDSVQAARVRERAQVGARARRDRRRRGARTSL